MKRLRWLIALAGLSAFACAHVVPTVVDCGKEVSADILPAVESALVASDYVDELTKLVGKFGICLVRNAVAQITGEAKQDVSFAQSDSNARTKYEHGTSWLAAHPKN